MAANRGDSFAGALSRVWGRGGVLGCKHSFQITSAHTLTDALPQTTKVSSPGPGSKLPQKARSSSLWPPKPNFTPNPSEPTTSSAVSPVAWPEVSPKHTLQWASVLA